LAEWQRLKQFERLVGIRLVQQNTAPSRSERANQ